MGCDTFFSQRFGAAVVIWFANVQNKTVIVNIAIDYIGIQCFVC